MEPEFNRDRTVVLVSYSLQPVPERLEVMKGVYAATVKAPSNYKDAEKISEFVNRSIQQFEDEYSERPFASTFGRIVLTIPASRSSASWSRDDRQQGKKSSVASVCVGFLKRYLLYEDASPFTLVGFGIQRFLQALYAECALEGVQVPNSLRHGREQFAQDMSDLILGYTSESPTRLRTALQAFGPDIAGIPLLDYQPGKDLEADQVIMLELLCRFSLLDAGLGNGIAEKV